MANEQEKPKEHQDDVEKAIRDVHQNDHQDLSKENLGNEPEEQTEGDPESPYRLKGLDDKRPEDEHIKKGWTVDSNTSRGPQELDDDEGEEN